MVTSGGDFEGAKAPQIVAIIGRLVDPETGIACLDQMFVADKKTVAKNVASLLICSQFAWNRS